MQAAGSRVPVTTSLRGGGDRTARQKGAVIEAREPPAFLLVSFVTPLGDSAGDFRTFFDTAGCDDRRPEGLAVRRSDRKLGALIPSHFCIESQSRATRRRDNRVIHLYIADRRER